jgi:hypothetical protein
MNIIATLVSFGECRVTNRFQPSTCLKQLEDVFQEECYKILLATVQNLYKSISRRTAAVLKAEGGTTL